MECHRCKRQAEVQAGLYRGITFSKTPCGRCELGDRSAFVMKFDEERGAADEMGGGEQPVEPRQARLTLEEISTRDVPFPEEYEDEPVVPMSVMADVIWRLLTVPPRTRDVICWRFAGRSYREIGRALGISMAAAEACHRRALNTWPALRVLFSSKATKQAHRKPHTRSNDAETEAFRGDFAGVAGRDGEVGAERETATSGCG